MLTITIIIYGIVGIFIDRKANKAKARIDALQSALVALEKNTNDKTKELQSKLDDLTALKVQELDDYFTPIDNLTSRQKLRRLGRAKEVIGLAFKVVDEYGKGRPTELTKNTHRLSLRLISEAQSLAQAQLVAEGGKVAFERGGVVSPSDRGEDGELLLFDKKNPWWPSSKKIPRK